MFTTPFTPKQYPNNAAKMDLQKRIDQLREQGFNNFALQDRPGKLTKASCGRFYPANKEKRGWANNGDEVSRDLVAYVNKFPGLYTLHYSRSLITSGTESFEIDTRPLDEQTPQTFNLADMDERNKDEKRSDELYIREILSKNGFLESEVQRLKDKIEELESMLEDAETEAEENKHAQMADATTSTIGQVAQLIPTLLDKYFAIQEQKNALLAEQIRRQSPPRPQPQNQTFEQPANGFYYEGEN
jgi:predicted ribosome quality control (RQC) complex YloA/Tae2 family protein